MIPPPQLVVELRRSGRTVLVPPTLTVLEALENEGVPIASMCRAGICGTCETTALSATEQRSTSAPHPATEPGSVSVSPGVLGPSVPRLVIGPGWPKESSRVTEPVSPTVSGPVRERGSPNVLPSGTESRSVAVPGSATQSSSLSPTRPAMGSAADRYPRRVRLCVTAPGTLIHLVLDL
ncbi:2Fe-2S iron-sulfur cluster-binding protein [Nocardia sp. NPDC006044]|uniref:2Fe-2S iron-sulfur cluster-binding protein n=1 Tax=Nocardia sp. NPDC006044 TaxID=3364306 RepID=UPI00368C6366